MLSLKKARKLKVHFFLMLLYLHAEVGGGGWCGPGVHGLFGNSPAQGMSVGGSPRSGGMSLGQWNGKHSVLQLGQARPSSLVLLSGSQRSPLGTAVKWWCKNNHWSCLTMLVHSCATRCWIQSGSYTRTPN